MSARYLWTPGSRVPVPAQVAGEELDRIREVSGGVLKQEDVVAAAEPVGSPLHPAFEWRDTEAARLYRLTQANYLIRSIKVAYEVNDEPRAFHAFVSVSTGDETRPSYVAFSDAMSDPALRRQTLESAMAALTAWRNRYRELEELSALFEAIDPFL
jgi:hypothetical protein